MAHPINDKLDKNEGKTKKTCNSECNYYAFPNLDRACVLSDVYSVLKGQGCYIKASGRKDNEINR